MLDDLAVKNKENRCFRFEEKSVHALAQSASMLCAICADNGNRTHIICVEDREFTINPYPHTSWSECKHSFEEKKKREIANEKSLVWKEVKNVWCFINAWCDCNVMFQKCADEMCGDILGIGSKGVFACLWRWEESPNCFLMRVNDLREYSQGKSYSALFGMKSVRNVFLTKETPSSAKHIVALACERS